METVKIDKRTAVQRRRESRDTALYEEWVRLTSVEGQCKQNVTGYLMRKYDINSPSTIYAIIKRVEGRS